MSGMSNKSEKLRHKQVFCDLCCCYIPSASLVASHEKGKKHQLVLTKQKKKKKSLDCSVYIRGFNKGSDVENELTEILSRYGIIKEIYVDKEKGKYAIVEFEAESSVQNLLKEGDKLAVNGNHIVIRPRKSKESETHKDIKSNIAQRQSKEEFQTIILKVLNDCDNVQQQIIKLVETQQLTDTDILLRRKICELLQEVFKEVYADCDILPFGSTVSKLGCKGCDLDITLVTKDLGGYVHKNTCSQSICCSGDDAGSVGSTTAIDNDISEVCQILRKFVPGCKDVFALKSAHCPVIKFFHKNSSLHCDLSINNRLAVHNSKLLNSYCEADERFRYLSYAVRFWADSKDIAGKGALQMTKYALVLMVIHYLQQCDPPVLPCLQEKAETNTKECFIDGWNCYYDTNFKPNKTNHNPSSFGELLFGFFKYFAKYNWSEHVLSISSVKLQTKGNFLAKLDAVGLRTKFRVGPVCIVDPFEATHNVAQNLTEAGQVNLKTEIENALQILYQEIENVENIRAGEEILSSDTRFGRNIKNSEKLNFDQIDLKNLLQPVAPKVAIEKHKRLNVKYVFDVYDADRKSSAEACQRCANIAIRILTLDLKMQCSVKYNHQKQMHSCDQPTFEKECSPGHTCNINANNTVLEESNEKGGSLVKEGEYKFALKRKFEAPVGVTKNTGKQTFAAIHDSNESEPSNKRHCSVKTALKHVDANADSECCFASIEVQATAWANTWVKRRRQNRLLKRLGNGSVEEQMNGENEHSNNSTLSSLETSITDSCNDSKSPRLENSTFQCSSAQSSKEFLSFPGGSKDMLELSAKQAEEVSKEVVDNTSGPIFVSNMTFTINDQLPSEPKCRVKVKLNQAGAGRLSDFHSFFAFFKKAILGEMKQ
ncbi:speckle targeted PIP5K1A-regulated poly(A) polymerase-like isoform X1 [Rhopilema esculentum]|uniref:speckle targeted PIP5K1A-regulated poly(A) polymerase-like isoform X1 n=1 Tax=Rhopilema esculentum TaxID=499914 RepID=UPI0031D9A094